MTSTRILALSFLAAVIGFHCSIHKVYGQSEKDKVTKTDAQWRQLLTPEQFEITRQKGTERPFTGKYWKSNQDGIYTCVCCGQELFDSKTKFKSGTGWPSYFAPISKKATRNVADLSYGSVRTEVTCRRCDAHLGHVFGDGPKPTGLRYCMNSAALKFVPRPAETRTVTYGATSQQGLLNKIETAIANQSKSEFLECTCWERLPETTQQNLQKTEPMFLKKKLADIKVAASQDPVELEGFEYNVQFLGFVELTYEGTAEPVRVPFGKFNNRYYLASLVKKGRFDNQVDDKN